MPKFGLIGKKLGHSFSKNYFDNKFKELALDNHSYELFELEDIADITPLLEIKELRGMNVTVPYKELIIPYLDKLDSSAQSVGAVNVISIENGEKIGYNSDFYGFKSSLVAWLDKTERYHALILGSGGASKAVAAVLRDLNIPYLIISRSQKIGDVTYESLASKPVILEEYNLIINTTPLGMSPEPDSCPDLAYDKLSSNHWLFDLVYNPEKTKFLTLGESQGTKIKNGLEMLRLQAEKSWEIWSNTGTV